MSHLNRLGNTGNRYQGDYKKVLCICSAGLLRSPTAAVVLSLEPFNYNTRAAGLVEEYALILVDDVLIEWADEIVVMDLGQKRELERKFKPLLKPIINLDIKDDFVYRDPELIRLIRENYQKQTQ